MIFLELRGKDAPKRKAFPGEVGTPKGQGPPGSGGPC
jgi:hypothetical protein